VSNRVCQLRIPFAVRGDSVFWGDNEIPDADPKTFVGLSNVWGADHKTVFTEWRRRNIDRSSFEFLNGVFVRDRAHVYDYHGIVEGADPQSFTCLDAGLVSEEGGVTNNVWQRGYARDASHVYYHDQHSGRASVVRGADPHTFVSFANCYGRDHRSVYYEKLRIPTDRPMQWLYLGRKYSTDGDRVFYFNRVMSGVKPAEMQIVLLPTIGTYATDGRSCFRGDSNISKAEFDEAMARTLESLPQWVAVAAASN
jgi:hypothetical protein